MAKFLRSALTHASIHSSTVHSGETAFLRLAKERFDLILLDISLPGMSGLDVCRRLKADPQLRHLPVIFLTTYHDHQMQAQAFALGAAEYLTKPVDLPRFLKCLLRHLASAAVTRDGQSPVSRLLP